MIRKALTSISCLFALCMLPALWMVTVAGKQDLTPPGWLAVLVTVLPYLYALLFAYYVILHIFLRKRFFWLLEILLVFSLLVFWGESVPSGKVTTIGEGSKTLRVMVWNVQRMGIFSLDKKNRDDRLGGISKIIGEHKPDVVVLLEISHDQLTELRTRLGLPGGSFAWSDYHGTGNRRFGGLAVCIINGESGFTISRTRRLGLPPGWKYVFTELTHESGYAINVFAIHVAPPKVSDHEVKNALLSLVKFKPGSVGEGIRLLKNYEAQVTLQGRQGENALALIRSLKDPTIIAGDFNSTRDAALHVKLRGRLIDTFSRAGKGFGATRYWGDILPLRIDYIYVTDDFKVVSSEVIDSDLSDHRPLVSSVILENK